MQIKSKITRRNGQVCDCIYTEEGNPEENLNGAILHGVHACCFYEDKLLVVYGGKEKGWTLAGGAIEPGETWQEAIVREVKEESNMKVLHCELIGYQDVYQVTETVRQTRAFCIIEPYGEFVADPDEDITEIKLIDPKDYKKYFDWGDIMDRTIERALEIKEKYEISIR